jgi:predicted MFS family arabinose efflux permease
LLFTGALATMVWSDVITIELLFANTLLLGIAIGFSQPARWSLVPSLVSRGDLTAAVAFNALMSSIGRLVGPAIAGAVIVGGGAALAFTLNAASFAVFLVALWRLDRILPASEPDTRGGETGARGRLAAFVTDIVEGFAYAARHPGIAPLLLLFAVVGLFGRPFTELLAGIAAQIYGSGAQGLAALTAASGVGALCGSTMLAMRSSAAGTTRLIVHHTLLLALALVVLVATDRLVLGLLASALAGYAMVIGAVGTQMLIQMTVAGAARGRVMSLYGLILRGCVALGALLMGALSEIWGMALPLVLGAGLCVLGYGWALLRLDRVARIVEGGQEDEPRGPAGVPERGNAMGRQ